MVSFENQALVYKGFVMNKRLKKKPYLVGTKIVDRQVTRWSKYWFPNGKGTNSWLLGMAGTCICWAAQVPTPAGHRMMWFRINRWSSKVEVRSKADTWNWIYSILKILQYNQFLMCSWVVVKHHSKTIFRSCSDIISEFVFLYPNLR